MDQQSIIYKGLDNAVLMNISTQPAFDRIELFIGGETYSTDLTPDQLFVDGDYLTLSIGDTTALANGAYSLRIIGYSATYNDGYLITDRTMGNLGPVIVKTLS